MYLTYDEYLDMGGREIEEEVFARHMARANATITRMTHGRILNESPVRDSAKYAAYDLVNAIQADESLGGVASGREIAAMSNDGVSVTFASGSGGNGVADCSVRYANIVREWLTFEVTDRGIPLLYAGVDA
jgi:hypothetical protein